MLVRLVVNQVQIHPDGALGLKEEEKRFVVHRFQFAKRMEYWRQGSDFTDTLFTVSEKNAFGYKQQNSQLTKK